MITTERDANFYHTRDPDPIMSNIISVTNPIYPGWSRE